MTNDGNLSGAPPSAATCLVETDGNFGAVLWTPSKHLYDLLPARTRDDMLEIVGDKRLAPAFSDLTCNLANHFGIDGDPSSWGQSSAENVEVTCDLAGNLIWQLPQELWDALEEDQRPTVFSFCESIIHDKILHDLLAARLLAFAHRRMSR